MIVHLLLRLRWLILFGLLCVAPWALDRAFLAVDWYATAVGTLYGLFWYNRSKQFWCLWFGLYPLAVQVRQRLPHWSIYLVRQHMPYWFVVQVETLALAYAAAFLIHAGVGSWIMKGQRRPGWWPAPDLPRGFPQWPLVALVLLIGLRVDTAAIAHAGFLATTTFALGGLSLCLYLFYQALRRGEPILAGVGIGIEPVASPPPATRDNVIPLPIRPQSPDAASAQGKRFEHWVYRQLKYLQPQGYVVLYDLKILGINTSQIDHVAIGPNGIFCVEAKYRSKGAIITIEPHQWLITYRPGAPVMPEVDAVAQNDAHIQDLRAFLARHLPSEYAAITLHNVVCLSEGIRVEGEEHVQGALLARPHHLRRTISAARGHNPLTLEQRSHLRELLLQETRLRYGGKMP